MPPQSGWATEATHVAWVDGFSQAAKAASSGLLDDRATTANNDSTGACFFTAQERLEGPGAQARPFFADARAQRATQSGYLGGAQLLAPPSGCAATR